MFDGEGRKRPEDVKFNLIGTGVPYGRNCMPGNHTVANSNGGRTLFWRGGRFWFCKSCTEAELEKRKERDRLAAGSATG